MVNSPLYASGARPESSAIEPTLGAPGSGAAVVTSMVSGESAERLAETTSASLGSSPTVTASSSMVLGLR